MYVQEFLPFPIRQQQTHKQGMDPIALSGSCSLAFYLLYSDGVAPTEKKMVYRKDDILCSCLLADAIRSLAVFKTVDTSGSTLDLLFSRLHAR